MMQRRGFLGLFGAAIAAPFVPTPAVPALPALTINEARSRTGLDLASTPDVGAITVVFHCDDCQFQDAARAMSDQLLAEIRRQPYRCVP
jgi:hypothetical protein